MGWIFEADGQRSSQDKPRTRHFVIPISAPSYPRLISKESRLTADSATMTPRGPALSSPGLSPRIIRTPVQTMQVAPTILQALGIDPGSLQAVQQEKTTILARFIPLDRGVCSIVEFPNDTVVHVRKSSGETGVTNSISQEEKIATSLKFHHDILASFALGSGAQESSR